MSKAIIWTLQNSCPSAWVNKYAKFNYSIYHHPIIQLKVNNNFLLLEKEVEKYDTLIVSSQFSAIKVASILKDKYNILAVGHQATKIFKNAGHSIIYTANDSNELLFYLNTNNKDKILHPCSEKSDIYIWPENVDSIPFYGPIPNSNFDISFLEINSKSIIVFGSPSSVDVWFENNYNFKDAILVTIGNTTTKRLAYYKKNNIISPQISTVNGLCKIIYKHLKCLK